MTVDDPGSAVPPVVVLGEVMTDVLVWPSGPVSVGTDVASRVRFAGGGSGANVAAWLAHLGVPVSFVGRVGDDLGGRLAVETLTAAGVATYVGVDETRPTGTCVVLVGSDGERSMLPDRGANDALAGEDLPAAVLRPGAHLHLTGYALLGEGSRPAAQEALERAALLRMSVSVTPSSAQPLREVGADAFLRWTRGADLLLTNADEAAELTGIADPRRAAAALAGHYREVVVTAGAGGAVWADGLVVATSPARQVGVTDTTGAGDAFTAGFLAEWLVNPEPEHALSAGNRLAAGAVATPGARPPA